MRTLSVRPRAKAPPLLRAHVFGNVGPLEIFFCLGPCAPAEYGPILAGSLNSSRREFSGNANADDQIKQRPSA